jgi:hypothetical protein
MIGIVIAALVLAASVIGVDYIAPAISQWRKRRNVVRHSSVDQQMQAMRAAQQLSLLAWKARHELYDLAREQHGSQSRRATRRE